MSSIASQNSGTNTSEYPESVEPRSACPNCGHLHGLTDFYEASQVPVHSVLLMENPAEAMSYPKRDLRLSICQKCGFIFNRVFDPTMHEYSSRYEETQGFSEVFNAFSDRLARQLIERHDLRGKRIIEIGCGKGEFLTHICELGENSGLGFDPAYVPDRSRAEPSERVTFIKDFYSEAYAHHQADFICCKMTLEHIDDTRSFISMVRNAVANSPETIIFFQVPDVTRVLEEAAFWDIYYEHCSYFDTVSLRYLFESAGFEVIALWNDYDDQYLMIEARSSTVDITENGPPTAANGPRADRIEHFTWLVGELRSYWTEYLRKMKEQGRNVALWGGGSKAVAFLTTLQITDEVCCAVDINPHKHGTYLPGTGHPVVGPAALRSLRPDSIIVMNPVYMDEIRRELDSLELETALIPVNRESGWTDSEGLDVL